MHSPAGCHHREHLSLKDAAAVRETMRVTYPKLVTEDTRTHATIHSRTVRVYPDVIIVCQATPAPFPPGWNPDSELPFQAKRRSHIVRWLVQEGSKTVILACIALHNYIMTNDEHQLYCPPDFVDQENSAGIIEKVNVKQVERSNGDQSLPSMAKCNYNATKEAKNSEIYWLITLQIRSSIL
ncbi:hypothetical protein EVAR_73887_1 [Eumeta japonica]|uniref:Uncharacterized protein n=1 Tax=Eumeta variegata TaxID=151549 RepID=A0A4C1SVX0_EUMVA|nr:hypothetical protein EVAR_73887_1 [Eumeta japonica]